MNREVEFTALASELWHRILNVPHSTIFENAATDARDKGNDFDHLPQPGFVGSRYQVGGMLLVGKNPGNDHGKDMSLPDQIQYSLLSILKDSKDQASMISAFDQLNTVLVVSVMPEWTIFKKVVKPLLDGLNLSLDQIGYLNMVKYHTKTNEFSKALYEKSWALTLEQIELLAPSVIVVLGVSTHKVFIKYYRGAATVHKISRGIGDTFLPAAGAVDIAAICSAEREKLAVGASS